MTKQKSTKRALLASVLSMLLCVAMLVGSTFAWFTDSVTSGKNQIVAGNLDVELEYSIDGTNWTTVDENTNMFKEDALWEPGYTEVVYLKVRNAGSLALKYQFGINVADKVIGETADDKSIDLSNFIKFGVVENATAYTADDAGRTDARNAVKDTAVLVSSGYASPEGHLAKGSTSNMLALVVYMPEEVGNDANYGIGKTQPEIYMGINLVATQDTVESDSFDNDYDAGAKYPPKTVAVSSADDLLNAVEGADAGSTIALNNDITLASPLSVKGDITLDLGASKIEKNKNNENTINVSGDSANVTVKATTGGISAIGSNNRCFHINTSNSNIRVDGGTYSSQNYYSMECGTSAVNNVITVQNATFSGDRGINIASSDGNTVTVKDCTFTASKETIYIAGKNNTCTLENVTITSPKTFYSNAIYVRDFGDDHNVLYIKSGTYNCRIGGAVGNIIITGGSFSKDPTQYLAAGYKTTKNTTTNMWDVTADN